MQIVNFYFWEICLTKKDKKKKKKINKKKKRLKEKNKPFKFEKDFRGLKDREIKARKET